MTFIHKLQAAGVAIASNAFLSVASYAQASSSSGDSTNCMANTGGAGEKFWNSLLNFIGSPVFYLVMFLLALGGLYTAIVKQDTAGWWAVGFAAVGAASPKIFVTISGFFCGVLQPVVG